MIGISAITANNGWAMALTGILIVLAGLSTLAFIISQLHKILNYFDKERETPSVELRESPKGAWRTKGMTASLDAEMFNDPVLLARLYRPLTEELGSTFDLKQLYTILHKEDVPHPHLTIRSLREARLLVADGKGKFCWVI